MMKFLLGILCIGFCVGFVACSNGSESVSDEEKSVVSTNDFDSSEETGDAYNFTTSTEDILAVVSKLKNGETLKIEGKMTLDDVATLTNAIRTIDEDEILIDIDMKSVTGLVYVDFGHGFYGCKALHSIKLPPSLLSISDYAFGDCRNLVSVSGDNIQYINGLHGCTSLVHFTVPKRVTNIDNYSFQGCTNLESLTIGKKLERFGYCVLGDSPNLSVINYDGTIEDFSKIILDDFQTDWCTRVVLNCSDGKYSIFSWGHNKTFSARRIDE